ncbi:flagellar hook capping FlgD N-terminal domain-containing protein [Campylobacter sp.]|uniref:flagellar hook capping FlgD N-terminal domain-containing protein n=1 Tax=Campylobacter sp. TaxID=205 RepID=UPI002AA9268E|nr:flagellar hook capping FlgD N-terminal domain-containing protein [Campylobacter sp.]MCI7076840.1 flagellar biosynthesis protein FlgD [Campylobacter sp.]
MADYMDTTNTTSALNNAFASTNASTVRSSTPTNPNAELKQEDFLALLLTELQYQDPTEPMDSQKMLEQTSMLSQLSMQQKTNDVMQKLASQMESAFSMSAMNALGSYATISSSVTKDAATKSLGLPVNFPEDISGATIEVKNNTGTVVRNIELAAMTKGAATIEWDLLNNNKNQVDNGTYTYEVKYTTKDGRQIDMQNTNYLIESVRFQKGEAEFKVAGNYIKANRISEFSAIPSSNS